jgi:prepilin-type processing-associated H-X9-DG protein
MMDGVPVPLPAGQYGALATFSGVPMIDDCRSGNPSERNDPVADDTSEFMSHMTPGASANAGWPSWRHSQTSINSLRVDGHVENMPLENEDTGLCNLLQRNIMLNY